MIPSEKGETWRDVIHVWYPIHKDRMEAMHSTCPPEIEFISFFETIEIERKLHEEAQKHPIEAPEIPEGADE